MKLNFLYEIRDIYYFLANFTASVTLYKPLENQETE